MGFVDLSHVIVDGMVTYPGLPGPTIGVHVSFADSHRLYDPGTEFTIGRITMVSNTGTYLDTPAHRYRDGHDLAALELARVADLPVIVVDADPGGPIGAEQVPDDPAGHAVLYRTGWDQHWGTQRYGDPEHPFLTGEAAEILAARRAALVGIDSVNIDDTRGGSRPAHSMLLAAGIPIVEHLTGLTALPTTGGRFFAVPVKVAGMGTFPVRAFAIV